jgi:hypothetical protein
MPPAFKDALDQQCVIPNPTDRPVLHPRLKITDLPFALTVPKPIRSAILFCFYTGSEYREFLGVPRDELVSDNSNDLSITGGPQWKEGYELIVLADKAIEVDGSRVMESRQDAKQRAIYRMFMRELGIRELFPCWDFNDVANFGA